MSVRILPSKSIAHGKRSMPHNLALSDPPGKPKSSPDPVPARSLRDAIRASKERDKQRSWWQKLVDDR